MTSHSLNIKNLAIAMEAVSRINGKEDLQRNLQNLIDEEMEHLYKEQHPELKPLSEYTKSTQTQDDEIPF